MNRRERILLKDLQNELNNCVEEVKQILEKDGVDLCNEEDVSTNLVMPIVIKVFTLCNKENYLIEEKFIINTKIPDICIQSLDNKLCYIVEVKKVKDSSTNSYVSLLRNSHLNQIKDYFSLCKEKPFFIVLTNGIQYKFFSNFSNPHVLDSIPFFSFSILGDTIDSLKLFKLFKLRFYDRPSSIKMSIRAAFDDNEIGLRLNVKAIREKRNLTQQQLGEKLGFTQQRVNGIEKNKCNPTLNLVYRLSDALNCTIDELVIHPKRKNESANPYLSIINQFKQIAPNAYIRNYLEDIENELFEMGLINLHI
jgi:putative transcriptional regulator